MKKTRSKEKTHAEKMMQKRIDKATSDMCRSTIKLLIPCIYLILAESFDFRNDEIIKLNKLIQSNVSRYKGTELLDPVYLEQVIELLVDKYGIDRQILFELLGE